jgi:hypothetical protein
VLLVPLAGGTVEFVPLLGGRVLLEGGGGGSCAKAIDNSSTKTTSLTLFWAIFPDFFVKLEINIIHISLFSGLNL